MLREVAQLGPSSGAGQATLDASYCHDWPSEPSIATCAATGIFLYRYRELVRKNITKEYDGVVHVTELERHCEEEEFLAAFGMSKAEFQKLPTWKRMQHKKSLLLF